MIAPIGAAALLDILEIIPGIWIQSKFGQSFNEAAFELQAFFGQIHKTIQFFKKFFFIFGSVAKTRHINGDYADRTGHRIGTKKSAAALIELAIVETQAAAHAPSIIRTHVRIDEIGEIRHAVFGSHFPNRVQGLILPIKIFGNIIGRNRKGKHPVLRITFTHHFGKSLVDHIHFFLELTVFFLLRFSGNYDRLVLVRRRNLHIKRNVGKRCLKSDPSRNIHIENKFLQSLFDFLLGKFVKMDERSEKRVEVGKSLGAISFSLESIDEVHHLPESAPEMLGRGAVHLARHASKTFHEQIMQVPTATIGRHHLQIMHVQITFFMGIADILGIDFVHPIFGTDR